MTKIVSKLNKLYEARAQLNREIKDIESDIINEAINYVGTALYFDKSSYTIGILNFIFHNEHRFYFTSEYTIFDTFIETFSKWEHHKTIDVDLLVEVFDKEPFNNETKKIDSFKHQELFEFLLISKINHTYTDFNLFYSQTHFDTLEYLKTQNILNEHQLALFDIESKFNFDYLGKMLSNEISGFSHPDFDFDETNGNTMPVSKLGLLRLLARLKDFSNQHQKEFLTHKLNNDLAVSTTKDKKTKV